MTSPRRRRFAEGVTGTFEAVRYLYGAIDRLNLDLRDALQTPPTPLRAVGGTSLGKTTDRDDERRTIRAWYGRVHAPGLPQDNESEEESPSDDEADEDGTPPRKRRSPPVALGMNDRLLAIKLVLFESGNPSFEPVMRYAVIGDWLISGRHQAGLRAKNFAIPRNMLRRLLRPLPASGARVDRIATNAKVRLPKGAKIGKGKGSNQLSYRCFGGVKEKPLYDLDSPQQLAVLVKAIKQHWSRGGRSGR